MNDASAPRIGRSEKNGIGGTILDRQGLGGALREQSRVKFASNPELATSVIPGRLDATSHMSLARARVGPCVAATSNSSRASFLGKQVLRRARTAGGEPVELSIDRRIETDAISLSNLRHGAARFGVKHLAFAGADEG